jgi:hypothetical protein
VKLEYLDFGIQALPPQALPPVPPSSEVANVTGYLAEKLEHIKLGCQ